MRVGLALLALVAVTAVQASAVPPRASVVTRGHVTYFSLTVGEAKQVAGVCERRGLAWCGDLVTGGDGDQFASDCGRPGRLVARALRVAAEAASARGSGWEIVTRTETGGYPYTCAFAPRHGRLLAFCAGREVTRGELAARPLVERLVALATNFLCIVPGWTE